MDFKDQKMIDFLESVSFFAYRDLFLRVCLLLLYSFLFGWKEEPYRFMISLSVSPSLSPSLL